MRVLAGPDVLARMLGEAREDASDEVTGLLQLRRLVRGRLRLAERAQRWSNLQGRGHGGPQVGALDG